MTWANEEQRSEDITTTTTSSDVTKTGLCLDFAIFTTTS